MFNGRRQPSRDGTSRMTREYQVRFCERLGVKFPGPTRHEATMPQALLMSATTSTGHAERLGFFCSVPQPDLSRCSNVLQLLDHLVGGREHWF
jgi:hypothetical protein